MRNLSIKYNCSIRTIQQIWKKYDDDIRNGVQYPIVEPQKKGKCGQKSKFNEDIAMAIIEVNNINEGNLTFSQLSREIMNLDEGFFVSTSAIRRYSLMMGGKYIVCLVHTTDNSTLFRVSK